MKNVNKFLFTIIILFIIFEFSPETFPNSSSLFTKNCLEDNKKFVVKKIFDGDTILVETLRRNVSTNGDYKIRLLGIDAFEHDQLPFGPKGKEFLTMLLLNKTVCVETDANEKDIYGRTLGYVFSDSVFINEELLKNGLVILYDFPPNVKYIDRLKKAQRNARENMLGVWEKQNFILETPAQWRYKQKKQLSKPN